jgi:hypothetical protein
MIGLTQSEHVNAGPVLGETVATAEPSMPACVEIPATAIYIERIERKG